MAALGLIELFNVQDLATTLGTMVLDGSTDAAAALLQANKAGSIDRLGLCITAVDGTPPTYDIRLESLTANEPSGSLIAANTNKTFTPVATGWTWYTMTAARTVAEGDKLAVVVNYNTGTIDASNRITVPHYMNLTNFNWPYGSDTTTLASWTERPGPPIIAARYSDGEVVLGSMPFTGQPSANTFDNADTPDEIGIKWVQPFTGDCVGASLAVFRPAATGSTFDIVLYDSADNVLASFSGVEAGSTAVNRRVRCFWDGVTLTSGETYRLVLKPTHASNTVQFYDFVCPDSDSLTACGWTGVSKTTRTDAGAWTDTSNAFATIAPIMDVATAASSTIVVPVHQTNIVLPKPSIVGY